MYCYVGISLSVFVQYEEIILKQLGEVSCRTLIQDGNHFKCLVHKDNMKFCLMIIGMNCDKQPLMPLICNTKSSSRIV